MNPSGTSCLKKFILAAMLVLSISGWGVLASKELSFAQTITITPATLPTPSLDATYNQQLTQTGGSGSITWSISEGSLPSGIRLGASGVLSGQPNATGAFNFTVKVTDGNGLMGTRAYTLTINCLPFTITPATFATARVGEQYMQTFGASFNSSASFTSIFDGNAAFAPVPDATFNFTLMGTLPSGLSFWPNFVVPPGGRINLISGMPTESGTFNFTIKATPIGNTDASCMASRDYTLVVQDTAPQVVSNVGVSPVCNGPGNIVTVTATVAHRNANSLPGNLTSTLKPTLKALPGTCTADVGACTMANASTVTWTGTLTGLQVATISYKAQITDDAEPGSAICATATATVGTSQPASSTACRTVNCLPAGPGGIFPATSEMSDQKSGSVLIYNAYTSSTDPTRQNTRINITNSHAQLPVFVHLFFVAESCSVADSYVCLTGNQTTSFLASDLDPGTTGYLVAVAVDSRGCPINFNYLAGDEFVKFASGHAANLGAQAFAAIAGGLPLCDSNSVTTAIAFNGISYNRVPRVLAASGFGSKADGNDTLLILNRIGGNLGVGASTLGTLFGILYDDAENSLSFSITGSCQLRGSLSNNFPRITPRFETFIPAGRTGWLKVFSQEPTDIGILGSQINFNPNAASSAGAFNQGHNLHGLTLSATNSYIIPVFPPGC